MAFNNPNNTLTLLQREVTICVTHSREGHKVVVAPKTEEEKKYSQMRKYETSGTHFIENIYSFSCYLVVCFPCSKPS